jgi:hypothetical protein
MKTRSCFDIDPVKPETADATSVPIEALAEEAERQYLAEQRSIIASKTIARLKLCAATRQRTAKEDAGE